MGLPLKTGADPGYLVGGGANIQFYQIFLKICMKLRKFGSVGVALDPPLKNIEKSR